MEKTQILTFYVMIILITCMVSAVDVSGEAYSLEISVPSDYGTIQEAINHANSGSTIFVSSGLYHERVIINKTVTLMGENKETTILDGSYLGTVISISADNVKITGLKLQNTGWKWGRAGIEVNNSDNCVIEDNFVYLTCHQIRLIGSHDSRVASNIVSAPSHPFPQSAYGIRLENCTDCLVIDNSISNNIGGIHFENSVNCTATQNYVFQNDQGIRLYSPCVDNKVIGNTIFNNTYDGMIEALPTNTTFARNLFCRNNFINNSQPFIYKTTGCIWDDGHEGNYWTKYEGEDTNQDGIGDTYFTIGHEQDLHPLMGRHYEYEVLQDERTFKLELICNSEILDFHFGTDEPNTGAITVNLRNDTGKSGFSRIAIPTDLLARPYTVKADDSLEANATLRELSESNSTHTVLYFNYDDTTSKIEISGTFNATNNSSVLPYLIPASTLVAALVVITLIVLLKGRSKNAKKPPP